MHDDGDPGARPGSVPHTWRNALFWRWSKDLRPRRPLRDGFLKVLQACGAAANASGQLKFADGQPIKLRAIAAAACVDEKDARRYMAAAEAAGVITVTGGRGRGRSTLYSLAVAPWPDWDTAVDELTRSRRAPRHAPPWTAADTAEPSPAPAPASTEGVTADSPAPPPPDASSGDTPPTQFGGHTPEPPTPDAKEVRGTHPRPSSGDTPPTTSGDTPPNNPGRPMGLPHGMAEVSQKPQVAHARGQDPLATGPTNNTTNPAPEVPASGDAVTVQRRRCPGCDQPMLTATGATARNQCGACRPRPTRRTRSRPRRTA